MRHKGGNAANLRGNGSVIHSEGGHWKDNRCHREHTGEDIVVGGSIDDSSRNDPHRMTMETASCEKNPSSEETENILEGRCCGGIDANRWGCILLGNCSETSCRRQCRTAKCDAVQKSLCLDFDHDGRQEMQAFGLDWLVGSRRRFATGRQWQCGPSMLARPHVTANPYGLTMNVDCWQVVATVSVMGFELLRVCAGGVSRVGNVSCRLQILSESGREIVVSSGGGLRRRLGKEICGKSDGDAVRGLDDRENGVFVSWIRTWSLDLDRAVAGCAPSCNVSCVTSSETGCGCGFDFCVA